MPQSESSCKNKPGDIKKYLKIVPKVTENGPDKFGKIAVQNFRCSEEIWRGRFPSVLNPFQRDIQIPRFYLHEASDAVLKTYRGIRFF